MKKPKIIKAWAMIKRGKLDLNEISKNKEWANFWIRSGKKMVEIEIKLLK
jgi:hypothetical protein